MARAALKIVPKEPTIGQLIDLMDKNRDERRLLEDKIKGLNASFSEWESKLISLLKEQSIDKSQGSTATAALSEATTFSVEDRAALDAFIKKTGYAQIHTNHVSSASCAEILAMNPRLKGNIPGLKSFTKVAIKLTKLRTPKE